MSQGAEQEADGETAENDADAAGAADESSGGETGATTGADGPAAIGVKLGSTRTVVAAPDGDGVETIQTLTCLATYEDALTGEEKVLYGQQAATEYPDSVQFMLRSGLPEDDESADLAETFFRSFVESNDLPEDSVVVYAVPTIEEERGLENLTNVVEGAPIGDVTMRSYPESLCGSIPAVGTGLDAVERTFLGVNLGSTNLEVSAYRRGSQLHRYATGSVTGSEVDRRIIAYVEDETQGRVNIDRTTAREYKEDHADFVDYEPFSDVLQQPGGGSHEFTIETSVMKAVDEYVDAVVDELANAFLPELANDNLKVYQRILEEPVVLTGGMTAIPGLVDEVEERLATELNQSVTCTAADDPATAAARGARRIATRFAEREQ
jgi:molecular chaperone DnaK (HSP70)